MAGFAHVSVGSKHRFPERPYSLKTCSFSCFLRASIGNRFKHYMRSSRNRRTSSTLQGKRLPALLWHFRGLSPRNAAGICNHVAVNSVSRIRAALGLIPDASNRDYEPRFGTWTSSSPAIRNLDKLQDVVGDLADGCDCCFPFKSVVFSGHDRPL